MAPPPRARRVSVPLGASVEDLEEPLMKDAEGFASVDYDLVLVVKAPAGSAPWEPVCRLAYAELDFVVHELHVERPSLSRAGASARGRAAQRDDRHRGRRPVKFAALRGGEDRLRREAARVGFSMLLDPARLAALAADRGVAVGVDASRGWLLPPYAHHYAPYHETGAPSPYAKRGPRGLGRDQGLFAGPDRVRLLASILAAPEAEGGCYLPLATAAVRDAAVVDYFPLVSALSLARLRERLPRRYVPFVREADHGAIRDVWGEHVALYFAFHSFQTRQLCFLAPTGLLCYGAATALKARGFYKFAAAIDVGFSIVVALWTIKFTRLWRRREAELALEFGTAGGGVWSTAAFYFPERLANAKKRGAAAVIAVVLSLVTAIIVVLFWIRSFLNALVPAVPRVGVPLGSIVAPALNAGLMAVDSAFGRISEATTDYENHRTETAYEGSYLASLFVSNLVIGNLLELDVPGHVYRWICGRRPSAPPPPPASSAAPERRLRWWTANHDRDERKDAEVHAAVCPELAEEIERQFARETFNPICLDDIAELMIQYGFCTFFVVAWPPVIALAILNNCVEFHVDRFKLTCICRPPFPVRVEDLGAWNDVLWVMSRLATLTNVFMFVYVSGGVDQYDATAKGLLFLLMEYLLVHVGMVIEGCVPEVPKRVVIQRKRNQFVVDRLLGPAGHRPNAPFHAGDPHPRDDGFPRRPEAHAGLLRAADHGAVAAEELRLLHEGRDHAQLLGVDRRPPHYRHETHRGLGEDLSQRRSSSSVEVLRVPCRELTDSAGSHLQSSSGTQQTGLTASSQAPSSWHSRPSD
ncbi:intracellular chloride channel [Aureococcus anophagefferens]|nr:intracellular chloride channel [Aureococcus anophagefferens]